MGYRARPDMYTSSPGSTPRWFFMASVLESFTPNTSPLRAATSFRFLISSTARSYLRSFSNTESGMSISRKPR